MIHLTTLLAEAKLKLNIPSDIKKIHKAFKKSGKKLYVVGGAVRDAILGKSPKDYDLATDAKPDEVMKIAKDNGLHAVDVGGKSFGVVEVGGHEVATFRKDIGKGRRPDAVDYTDIEGDVKRRDLTINALFYDIGRSEIVDLVGGIKDLTKKRIRTVGNASRRFDEDPLRKLRAVRFTASTGGKMHADTYNALKQSPDISAVSAERIRDEFVKGIKKAKSPKKYMQLLDELKMMRYIMQGLKTTKSHIDTNDHIIQISNLLKDNDYHKVVTQLKGLKYTNQEINDIGFLFKLKKTNSHDIYFMKKDQDNTTLSNKQLNDWGKIIGRSKFVNAVIKFKLSVKGKDMVKLGYKGAEIGKAIQNKETEKFNKYI